jgi:hypothetical protein
MHSPRSHQFHVTAGDREWAAKVRAFDVASTAYVLALKAPDAGPLMPPICAGPVLDLAAFRARKNAARGPCAAAFDAYRFAAVRLLAAWAPDSTELREQMRLAAELAGLPDPAHAEIRHHPADIADTPEAMLALIFQSSIGLWIADRNRSKSAAR